MRKQLQRPKCMRKPLQRPKSMRKPLQRPKSMRKPPQGHEQTVGAVNLEPKILSAIRMFASSGGQSSPLDNTCIVRGGGGDIVGKYHFPHLHF